MEEGVARRERRFLEFDPQPVHRRAEDMLALPGLLESAVNRFFYISKKSTYTQAYAWIEQRTALFGP